MVDLATRMRDVVGDKTADALADGLGLHTVRDLLGHYPRRYYERGQLADLGDLVPGSHVTVQAEVVRAEGRQIRPKLHKTDVIVTDGRHRLLVTFFNRKYLARTLTPGTTALFAGEVDAFKGRLQLKNPEVQRGEDAEDFAGALIPIYPATAKLPTWNIARCVRTVLATADLGADPLPEELRRRHGLLAYADALRGVHQPADRGEVERAQQRLKWDEAFVLQVALARRRAEARADPAVPRLARDDGLLDAFERRLPFTLTDGQVAVGEEIARDLASPHPMHRLLQGDVGSGKTVVALRAMLTVVDTGGQAALLAPTEVLAQQHHRSITTLLGPLADAGRLGGADVATRVALLTGSQASAVRRRALLEAASGEAGIVVGTHALLQEHVQFADLGLVVVDEQHRFGVEQRDALRAKGAKPPHVLVMTATPIPRTVAMTVYGDLETSALTELPGGRQPIQTNVIPLAEKPGWLERAWARVREEVGKGHQVYVVCPRIGGDNDEEPTGDEPEVTEGRRPAAAVSEVAPMLADGPLAGLRLELLHGRLAPDLKDDVMTRFSRGEVDVLVATTVVEVGVDVPNATVMVVLDADRFGVSQLHQLRGRVGRGAAAGLCLLVSDAEIGTPARERLDGVAATTDGFELARLDLEQRREGNVLGAEQSGRRSSLRLLSLLRDEDLIRTAREEATALVDADPGLEHQPALAAALAAALDEEQAVYLERA
jgi:ATP-dependent DNA helicase RecG